MAHRDDPRQCAGYYVLYPEPGLHGVVTPLKVIQGCEEVVDSPRMQGYNGLTTNMLFHRCRSIIINELIIKITDRSKYSIEYM